jgi:hypothetical protein
LIQKLGSAEGVRNASLAEIQDVLGPAMGRKIFEQLHPPVVEGVEGEPAVVDGEPGVEVES